MTVDERLRNAAVDGVEFPVSSNGGDWIVAWHPPTAVPDGTPHGATALCLTDDGGVVLVSNDGVSWDWPGGRPEADETWEDTLRREMLEETCTNVLEARLLGFCRAECLSGPEQGLVLVRSIWSAKVEMLDWEPRFEVNHRRVVPASEILTHLTMLDGFDPIYHRAIHEARLLHATPCPFCDGVCPACGGAVGESAGSARWILCSYCHASWVHGDCRHGNAND